MLNIGESMIFTDIDIIWSSAKIALTYTIKISIIVLISMFAMNYTINTGIMKRFSELMEPITKHLNVNPLSISSILVCFFSPTVGYSILAEGLRDKKLNEKEIIGTSLANSFPSVLSHTFTFFIPVVIPILGLTGLLFVLIRLGASLVKSLIGAIYLSIISKKVDFEVPEINKMDKKENLEKSLKSTLRFSKRLIPIMLITMFLVVYLSKIGVFDYLNNLVSPITNILGLNPNVGLLSLTEIVNVQAAIVMAGGFLNENMLSSKEVLIGLIIGNVLTFSTRYVKHSLPLHVSLFGTKLGTKIVMINAAITLLLDIIIIIGLLIL
ncbi:nucleoside recognition domain protein [Methanothermococcus okinawensis IH1]|uniref:Nucleoside recognition domain protein n=2 Tax=Methanothermococcus okinawensis TaxID=155863 RepID=F8AMP5_METOI|nr:nucleoside recognition domain protein [Methanothermococcus okinawensis IH1]